MTEVDLVSAKTVLPAAGAVRVSGRAGAPVFSFRWTIRRLSSAPTVSVGARCADGGGPNRPAR